MLVLHGIYMVFSHVLFSSLFRRAQPISLTGKLCKLMKSYKNYTFRSNFHRNRLTFKNHCKYHANQTLRGLSDALYVTPWEPLGRFQGSLGALLGSLERHGTAPGHLTLLQDGDFVWYLHGFLTYSIFKPV